MPRQNNASRAWFPKCLPIQRFFSLPAQRLPMRSGMMIDTVGFTARPAWMETALHGVRRVGHALRRRPFTAVVAQLGTIALIVLSIVPDAVCVELESYNATSTRGDGAHSESLASRRVCLNGGRLTSDPALALSLSRA